MPVHRTPNSVVRHRHQPYTPRSHHGNRRHGAGLFETLGHAGGSIVVFNFFVRPRLQITSVVVCNYSTRLIDDGSQQP